MNFVIRLFSEITIKSQPVRQRMGRQLADNIRLILKRHFTGVKVRQEWDKLEVRLDGEGDAVAQQAAQLLGKIPGIANFARVRIFTATDLHSIFEHTLSVWQGALTGKTFCVRAKRQGCHSFDSMELERYVGGGLNQHCATAGVKLHQPDVTVLLELQNDTLYVLEDKTQGLGGFPLGSQEGALSLVSGGFDSTLASFYSIRRGLRTHFCFFNLGGKAHELGVKEIAFYLWNRYGSSHRVKFFTVPFQGVVNEILEKVDPSCMGVVLKRMMLRAANQIAERGDIPALVTGEAVSQVSSQTLTNLAIIDRVTETLVLRPLATMDKGSIIDGVRAIGAEAFAAAIPEYCGVISVKPSAKLRLSKVEEQESLMDFTVLETALAATRIQAIDAVMADVDAGEQPIERVTEPTPNSIIIDIRHPDETQNKPLKQGVNAVLEIPFYRLSQQFAALDKTQQYWLYCERGVMSGLQAAGLKDEGYTNVGVYRPDLV